MPQTTFSDVVRVASTMPKGSARKELVMKLRAAKLEWDEDERKRLRRDNDDGFLLVPEGSIVGAHLNLNKRPFFNLKRPRKQGGRSDFPMETMGHVRALVLSRAYFYVGLTGSKKTALGGSQKSPYAGPVGRLTAAEVPEGGFGSVPSSGSSVLTFNPRAFPEYRSLFFCVNQDTPVDGAGDVIMRDWKLWASGPHAMSDAKIHERLEALGLNPDDMGSGARVASFMESEGVRPWTPTFNDDPMYTAVRSDLIRLAYQHDEARRYLLPLLR